MEIISKTATQKIKMLARPVGVSSGAPTHSRIWIGGALRSPGEVLTIKRMDALDLVRRGLAELTA